MRAIYIVLDSLGLGGAKDAASFGDVGANTFGHIAAWAEQGKADQAGLREGPLHIPNLLRLGLGEALKVSSGMDLASLRYDGAVEGLFGAADENSYGKDTPSGHYEMTGVPVLFDWMVFPKEVPAFPKWLTDRVIDEFDLPGILANSHASGTEIIARLGDEHIATGKPIFYTSADSVVQVAVHEEHFGIERLMDICKAIRSYPELETMGRVIARPFVGNGKDQPYKRTFNRKDFAKPCHEPTLLDVAHDDGVPVVALGKVGDIFAMRGISKSVKAGGNEAVVDALLDALKNDEDRAILFANLVEFDSEFGHRRNVPGYADALEAFDRRLPEIEAHLREGDLVVITADHGNDPTWPGTDHTRERAPVLFFGPAAGSGSVGVRDTFADIGQTFAQHLNLPPLKCGQSVME